MGSKTFAIDIDGVLCITEKSNYHKSKPNVLAINKVNQLYDKGNKIIIFTARFMGRNNNDISKAKAEGYELTVKQLKDWNVKYHKLIMGKPSFDIIIDDKAHNFNENWINDF